MATENPTGEGRAVTLTIAPGNEAFLRCTIGAARDGLRDELERFGDRLKGSKDRLQREEAAYTALLDALNSGRVVPGEELRAALVQLTEAVDWGNEYSRVVAEHDALHDLLGQLEGRSV